MVGVLHGSGRDAGSRTSLLRKAVLAETYSRSMWNGVFAHAAASRPQIYGVKSHPYFCTHVMPHNKPDSLNSTFK